MQKVPINDHLYRELFSMYAVEAVKIAESCEYQACVYAVLSVWSDVDGILSVVLYCVHDMYIVYVVNKLVSFTFVV